MINADPLALHSSRNSAKLENTSLSADGLQESAFDHAIYTAIIYYDIEKRF